MKKLFFFLSFVFCLSFTMSAQATFLPDVFAIDALKTAQSTLSTNAIALDSETAPTDMLALGMKRSSINGMIVIIKQSGNTEENLNQFFNNPVFSNNTVDPTLVNETRDFILSLISEGSGN